MHRQVPESQLRGRETDWNSRDVHLERVVNPGLWLAAVFARIESFERRGAVNRQARNKAMRDRFIVYLR